MGKEGARQTESWKQQHRECARRERGVKKNLQQDEASKGRGRNLEQAGGAPRTSGTRIAYSLPTRVSAAGDGANTDDNT